MNPAISLNGVRRSFGSNQVLRGVTVEAERGRVIGLLGRNGEGKTTLFRIILDMLAADSGSISVLGRSPDGIKRYQNRNGFTIEISRRHPFPARRSPCSGPAKTLS